MIGVGKGRVVGLVLASCLAASACGSTSEPAGDGVVPVSSVPRPQSDAQEPEAITIHSLHQNHLLNVFLALDSVRERGGYVAWSEVKSPTAEASVSFAITQVVGTTGPGVTTDEVVSPVTYGGPALSAGQEALVVVSGGETLQVAVSDGAGGFVLDEINWLQHDIAVVAAEFIAEVNEVPASKCSTATGSVHTDDLASAVAAYLAGVTPRQVNAAEVARIEKLLQTADRLANNDAAESIDPVAGIPVPHDELAIKGQLEKGVAANRITPSPTMPVYLDTGSLASDMRLMFIDGNFDAYLGYVDVGPGESSGYLNDDGSRAPIMEVFISPPSGALSVYVVEKSAMFGCTTNAALLEIARTEATLLVTASSESTDATHRPLMDLGLGAITSLAADDVSQLLGN